MVDRDVLLRKAIDKLCDFTVSLKLEQRDAVPFLLDGQDVLAVLPTGFGKSLIFKVFVIAAEMNRERLQTALVLCPLQSIINEQISETRNMGLSASAVADLSLKELRCAKFQVLFGSAVKVAEERLPITLAVFPSSFPREILGTLLTRRLRWGVETDVASCSFSF